MKDKIRWASLPNLGLSKDLRRIGLEEVICFDFLEFKPELRMEWVILNVTLENRAKELNAALCIKELDITMPVKYEVWFSQKSMNDYKWAGSDLL